MSSWANKKIIRKPTFKVITGNVIQNINPQKNIIQNINPQKTIISPTLGSNHREQIENFTVDDSINFDNLNLNIDNLGKQKIIIYDTEKLSICASLTNIYSNNYTEIVVTNNLSSIINNKYNPLYTLLLLTIPDEENILELYKLKNISNFNIYIIISKYIELNSNTILFNISDNVIFSSSELFNEYNKRYTINNNIYIIIIYIII
jgi:hypothetical protein